MAQQFNIGLRGLLKPEVDKRASRQAKKDVQDDLSEVEEIQPDVDTSSIEKSLEDFDLGGALGGGGLGDFGSESSGSSRGGGGGSGAAAGGMLGGATGGLAKMALGGAVAVGMLGALNATKNLLMAASPALQSTNSMFGEAMNLFFRPFGNFLSDLLRPMATELLEMGKNFNQSVGENGLAVAVMSGLTGISVDADLGENMLGGLGAMGGMVAGGVAGAKGGAALGAAAGSIIPGAGTAAGGTAGAIVGAIVGAISGTAIGGRIGAAIGEKIDQIDVPSFPGWPTIPAFSWPNLPEFSWPPVGDSWPGWPAIGSTWPGWPDLSTSTMIAEISWPSISTGDWLDQPSWPRVDTGSLLGEPTWPSISGGSVLSMPNWPSIGTGTLLGQPSWPSVSGGSIVGAIDWPSIDASLITDSIDVNGGGGGSGDGGILPFAEGGVVTGPTNAVIGEAGPEAVIPLDRFNEVASRAGGEQSQSTNRSAATSDDIRRLEDQLRNVVSELQNMGGDVVLQVGERELGAVSSEATDKFKRGPEVRK